MLYRKPKRRFGCAPLVIVMLAGLIGGVVFYVADNPRLLDRPAVAERFSPTNTPTQAEPTAPPPTPTESPAVATARILIPAAAVSAPIIPVFLDGSSWDVSRLGANVGHLQGTPWLDKPGNIVLSGHVELSDGRRGVFASLMELQEGDTVIVRYDGVERRYVVTEVRRVVPNDLSPLYPTPDDRLTLITCDEYDFFSDSYRQRVVIVAQRVS